MGIRAVVRNAVRPAYLPVMTHKVWLRMTVGHERERVAATRWASERAESVDEWGILIDATLWRESVQFAESLSESAQPQVRRLAAAGVDLGGPGGVELLYFLTRALRPIVAVETGVAAGWSTSAILAAMRANEAGHLYSSDFPFFRLPDPERYIGCVVPEDLKDSWTLLIKGDRRNLEEILPPGRQVGLLHYDSDKTRDGREFFLRRSRSHLAENHVIVMDDIQDNLVFREYAEAQPLFRVFEYLGKYIGMTGPGLMTMEKKGPVE